MSYFKSNDNDLENFIQKSKIKIENSLNRMDSKTFKQESVNFLPALVRKIVRNLDILTKEGKIIWSRDKKSVLRGIVIEDCLFSGYKIIIEKWDMPNICAKKIAGFAFLQKYKISFVKGILNAERIEYITNLEESHNEITRLFGTIEVKFFQQRN